MYTVFVVQNYFIFTDISGVVLVFIYIVNLTKLRMIVPIK